MIFLDTGYFKGLIDEKDVHHETALNIKDYINSTNETTVINTTVLVETLNKTKGIEDIKGIYDEINSENQIIHLTREDYLKSLMINGWYMNSINYSDCTIVNTMMKLKIRKIVSFDRGFEKIKGYHVISNI